MTLIRPHRILSLASKFPLSRHLATPVQPLTSIIPHNNSHSISSPHRSYSSESNNAPPNQRRPRPITTIKEVSKQSFHFLKHKYDQYDWMKLLMSLAFACFCSTLYLFWRMYLAYLKYRYGKHPDTVENETTAQLSSSKKASLEDAVHRIHDSKMPQNSVDRLPAIDIPRKVDNEFLSLFDGNEFQTVIVLGPKGCGKSTLVIKALKDRESVVKIEGFSTESVDTILGKIGKTGSREAAKEALAACKHKGRKPIIICEYKMTGSRDERKSTFKELVDTAKMWQHDEGICRVVFVLSDATLSSTLSKDPNRWISFWVGDFESDEATEYLQQHKIPDVDIPQYLDHLGPRPNDLLGLVNAVDKEQFIEEKEQEAREIIVGLRKSGKSKEQLELMKAVLEGGMVSQTTAWGILFPRIDDMVEQKKELLSFLKDVHLYQLMNGKILFHSRIKERVAQEMYRAGELKSGH